MPRHLTEGDVANIGPSWIGDKLIDESPNVVRLPEIGW
jgi:hypothetical protein